MRWQDLWAELFDEPPVDRTSREVSVQEVLAVLIAGRRCDWFVPYRPTSPTSASNAQVKILRTSMSINWECALRRQTPTRTYTC